MPEPTDDTSPWKKKRYIIPVSLFTFFAVVNIAGADSDPDAAPIARITDSSAISPTTLAVPTTEAPPATTAAPTTTTTTAAPKNDSKITMDEFTAIQTGMSYSRVVAIIGAPGEVMSESDLAGYKTVSYSWKGNSLGASAFLIIQNDSVFSKSQFGLE